MLDASVLAPGDLVTRLAWRPLPLVVIVGGVAAYATGVRRVAAAGRTWLPLRSAAFAVAAVVVAVATLSGLATYRPTSFSVAAVAQLGLFLLAPLALALAAPLTLLVEATSVRRPERAARIRAALTGRCGRILYHPVVAWAVYAVGVSCAYLTRQYAWAATHGWAGQLTDIELLVVGCVWIWPVVGADPRPRALGIGWRVVYVLLGFMFWSGLGLALQSQRSRIAPGVPLPDINTGGGILWSAAALAAIATSIGIVVQWLAVDEGHALRADRIHADEDAAQLAAWRAERRVAALADHRVRESVAVRSRPSGTPDTDRSATSARSPSGPAIGPLPSGEEEAWTGWRAGVPRPDGSDPAP